MKILIVGAGEVGYNIAARLVDESHDVMLIDRDEEMLSRATESLDIQGLRGHGARPSVLDEAGIADTDMVVAVTDSDEVNMVVCFNAAILGKEGLIKIARVREPGYMDPRIAGDSRLAIDLMINPEREAASKILNLLQYPAVTEIIDFASGKVKLMGLRVGATSPLAGMRFLDLNDRFTTLEVLIAAIHRGEEIIIPRGDDVILPGDEVYLVSRDGEEAPLLKAVGVEVVPVNRVMLAGGSRINRFVAEELERRGIKPKLVEPDAWLAGWLGRELPNTVVLHGSPTDAQLLQEENVSEMQAFVAAGKEEEANVMTALLARRLGARRVIATTNRGEYLPVMKGIGIDVCISPRLLAVGSILHFIRRGRVVAARSLGDEDTAEAIEFEVQPTCNAVGTPLFEFKLPKDAIIACIMREGASIIPSGRTVIHEGDHLIVVALRSAIPKVERLLRRAVER